MLIGFEWFSWTSFVLGMWVAYAQVIIQTIIFERGNRKQPQAMPPKGSTGIVGGLVVGFIAGFIVGAFFVDSYMPRGEGE